MPPVENEPGASLANSSQLAPAGTPDPDVGAYLLRGDDYYRGGPIGKALGVEADEADIQDFADHVLRKETRRSSRYTSFTTEVKIAKKFSRAADCRAVVKVKTAVLRELESQNVLRIWNSNQVYERLIRDTKKLAKQAGDVRTAMRRNGEILIEGQVPANVIDPIAE